MSTIITPNSNPAPHSDPDNPLQLLTYAINSGRREVLMLSVYSPSNPGGSLILKTGFKRRAIPPEMQSQFPPNPETGEQPTHLTTARALVVLPTDLVRNVQGEEDSRDVIVLMVVKRSAYDRMKAGLVAPSLIVPGV